MAPACIRCGACDRALAVPQIFPQAILAALRCGNTQRAIELGLETKLDWHACDTACPTGIPLSAIFSEAAHALAQERSRHAEHERALAWRENFRARNARLAREEAQAAEQRARKSTQPAVHDAVAAALARAKKARGEGDTK